MTPITILQSAADARPDWVSRCMRSVADWSQQQGYDYHCIGDELFDWVVPEFRDKLYGRTTILADWRGSVGLNRSWRCAADWWFGSTLIQW